jgi:hypothetical protein
MWRHRRNEDYRYSTDSVNCLFRNKERNPYRTSFQMQCIVEITFVAEAYPVGLAAWTDLGGEKLTR